MHEALQEQSIVTKEALATAAAWAAWYVRHGDHAEELLNLLAYLGAKIDEAKKPKPKSKIPEIQRAVSAIPPGSITLLAASKEFGIPKTRLYQRVRRKGIEHVFYAFHIKYYDYEALKALINEKRDIRQ